MSQYGYYEGMSSSVLYVERFFEYNENSLEKKEEKQNEMKRGKESSMIDEEDKR